MDHGPLVTEEIDAGAELVREFDKYEPVYERLAGRDRGARAA